VQVVIDALKNYMAWSAPVFMKIMVALHGISIGHLTCIG